MTLLLIALLQGDGTQKNHQEKTFVYYTTHEQLADDVQRLAFLAGYETAKWGPFVSETQFSKNLVMFQVHINMKPVLTRRRQRSSSVKKILVNKQRIVCFMVKNHTLVTRRNGKIGLHGNCKHAMHLVRLMRMGVEILQTGKVNVDRTNIDADELKAIRDGDWSYEKVETYSEEMDSRLDELYKTSTLPKNPDREFIDDLCMKVVKSYLEENK